MHLDLSDDETAALTKELDDITRNDRYPFSERIRTVKAILAKLRPEPVREPLPPPKVYARQTSTGLVYFSRSPSRPRNSPSRLFRYSDERGKRPLLPQIAEDRKYVSFGRLAIQYLSDYEALLASSFENGLAIFAPNDLGVGSERRIGDSRYP